MSLYEIIATLISIFAIIFSIASFYISRKTAQYQIEFQINDRISSAKNKITLISGELAKEQEAAKNSGGISDEYKRAFTQRIKAAQEDYLNALDKACGAYNDRKVDKKRFKQDYNVEIRETYETLPYKEILNDHTTPYNALKKVYKEWNNFEK